MQGYALIEFWLSLVPGIWRYLTNRICGCKLQENFPQGLKPKRFLPFAARLKVVPCYEAHNKRNGDGDEDAGYNSEHEARMASSGL
jgi:hypothetical protein